MPIWALLPLSVAFLAKPHVVMQQAILVRPSGTVACASGGTPGRKSAAETDADKQLTARKMEAALADAEEKELAESALHADANELIVDLPVDPEAAATHPHRAAEYGWEHETILPHPHPNKVAPHRRARGRSSREGDQSTSHD
jgi:hypothetical protein